MPRDSVDIGVTGASILVRRDVWTLPQSDPTMQEYAAAVGTMMGRPATSPLSWSYQAAMHGTHATSSQPLWNGCQHGTWYFLPWHRMFLYYFERIVRAAVVEAGGSADWTLPFWNYGAGGQQATLPVPFRAPHGNPLYVTRDPGVNGGQALSGAVTSSRHAMNCATFVGVTEFGGGITGVAQMSGQYGQIESQPHNVVHDAVGGQAGIMSDPLAAAGDPIFWLHHANIDRLWHIWAGSQHPAPTDPRWTTQSFAFFDEHGQQVRMTPADVLDTEQQLGYTYEVSPPAPAPAAVVAARRFAMSTSNNFAQPPELEPVGVAAAPVRLTGVPASTEISIDARAASAFLSARGEGSPAHVYLQLDQIQGERNPGRVYGVYVNLPDGADPATAEAHHAASLSFFGVERAAEPAGDEPGHTLSLTRDITSLLGTLRTDGEWDGAHLTVTFRPLGLVPPDRPDLAHALPSGLTGDDPPITVGSIRILYA
jgi:tyrosinase